MYKALISNKSNSYSLSKVSKQEYLPVKPAKRSSSCVIDIENLENKYKKYFTCFDSLDRRSVLLSFIAVA
jgi:hypothetical protein